MAVTAKDVMSLRQRTGLGMMECKEALNEASGDMDAAIDLLRKKLKGKMEERSDRAAAEGVVQIAREGNAVAIIELNTETDFVARGEAFNEAAQKIAQLVLASPKQGEVPADDAINQIIEEIRITSKENASYKRGTKLVAGEGEVIGDYLHHNGQVGVLVKVAGEADDDLLTGLSQHVAGHVPTPLAVDESGLAADAVEKQKAAAIQEAEASGKNAEIAEKIASGKLRKWIDDNTLVGQSYVRDMTGKTAVRDALPKGSSIKTFVRYQVGV
ncbi:MAG: translation elongation factor Ts [Phycisphaeraceae bacterium]